MDLVTFIDNAEDRIVVEVDAEWYERKFCSQMTNAHGDDLGHVTNGSLLIHMGLDIFWTITKVEYTGESYIITIHNMRYNIR